MKQIDLSLDGGSLFGYLVAAGQPNIRNYLAQHTDLADAVAERLRANGGLVALLRNMSVVEEERGNGIGTQLVSEFMAEADRAGASSYMLICDTQESQAPGFDLQAWYESFGFVAAMDTGEGPLMVIPEHLADGMASLRSGLPQQ